MYHPLPPSTAFYRLLPRPPPDPRTHAPTHLHREHVLAGVALQPQKPPVDVPRQRPAIKIRPQPAVRPLRDPPVGALGVDAAQQEAQLTVHPSPRGAHRVFVARSEENGVLLASRRRASGRDFQGSKVDLELEGARPFRLTPEPCADERRTGAQLPRDREQEARRRPHGSFEELALADRAERDGGGGHGFERLDVAPRHLEEPSGDGRHPSVAHIHAYAEPEGERELARRGHGVPAGDERSEEHTSELQSQSNLV